MVSRAWRIVAVLEAAALGALLLVVMGQSKVMHMQEIRIESHKTALSLLAKASEGNTWQAVYEAGKAIDRPVEASPKGTVRFNDLRITAQ